MVRSTLVVLLLLLGGCRHKDPEGAAVPADAPKEDVTLLVRNHHWLDINIYMMHGNVRQRLGTVTGASEKSFTIPWARLTGQIGLQLIADPVGQSGVLTEEVNAVRPGSVVEWTIESALRQSSIAVY
jgi:hypothetical protein